MRCDWILRYTAYAMVAAQLACGDDAAPGLMPDPNHPMATPDDRDGDGISNEDEARGYTIVVDEAGFGLGEASLLTARAVTSDPDRADTDADGLDDRRELLARSDARRADTDGDGLADGEELDRWKTSPISVDSDGDSRGLGRSAPNSALFDAAELALIADPIDASAKIPGPHATSPSLSDTDGDGVADFEELQNPTRSAVVADLPEIEIRIVDDVDVRLNVEFEDSIGTERSYGTEITNTNSSELSRADSTSTAMSAELSATVGVSVEASLPPGTTVSAEVTASVGIERTTTTEMTRTTAQELSEAKSRMEAESVGHTVHTEGGAISMGLKVLNTGKMTYDLRNLGITVRQLLANEGRFRSLTTLTAPAGFDTFVLQPGQETAVIPLAANGLDASLIKSFLANPTSLILEPAGYQLKNADGTDFGFLTEETIARTALLSIDFGNGEVRRFRVATNVDRGPDGELRGVRMADAMIMSGTNYRTEAKSGGGLSTLVAIQNAQGQEHAAAVRTSAAPDLGDPIYPAGKEPGARTAQQFWVLYGARPTGDLSLGLDFEKIAIEHGDQLRLAYVKDADGDGIYDREEFLYGSSDQNVQSDATANLPGGDGLSDYYEIRVGWEVAVEGAPTYQVKSSPILADTDGDGLDDLAEHGLGTDPTKADTDGDGFLDPVDPNPLQVAPNSPPVLQLSASFTNPRATISGSVTDAQDAVASLTIDWGDGGAPQSFANPAEAFTATHDYGVGGTKNIQVIAIDARGAESLPYSASVEVPTIPSAGLQVHVPFEGTVDSIEPTAVAGRLESSGVGHGFIADRFGNMSSAYQFTSSGGTYDYSYVELGVAALPADRFTAAMWIKRGQQQSNGTLLAQPGLFDFGIENGVPRIAMRGSVTASAMMTAPGIATGDWGFVAVVKDGNEVTLYLDGVAQSFTMPAMLITPCAELVINAGGGGCGGSSNQNDATGNAIDSVRVYDRALSPSEIEALFDEV